MTTTKAAMKLTIDQAIQKGVEAHKGGKLEDAERIYRTILQSEPAHTDANHNPVSYTQLTLTTTTYV